MTTRTRGVADVLDTLIAERCSCRAYLAEPVSDETLDLLLTRTARKAGPARKPSPGPGLHARILG